MYMTSITAFLFVFTTAVLVHELGHFIAARGLGIKAYEFSIGFPFSPRVATLFRHRETEFTLRLLPLGGFVSFAPEGEDDDTFAYLGEPGWKRAVVASAGSVFNMLFAVAALAAAFALGEGLSLTGSLASSLSTLSSAVAGTFGLIGGLVTGTAPVESLSGPVGIAMIAGKAAQGGFADLLFFTGMLSLSIGILNLLPLPALDGGHLVILAIESIKRRPLSMTAYKVVTAAGFSFIILLTLVVTWKDILKLAAA